MTLRDELELIYGARTGFHDFFDNFKFLCKRLEITHNNAKQVLFQFYTENFNISGKKNTINIEKNIEIAIEEIISRMQEFCFSDSINDKQAVKAFSEVLLYNKPISSFYLYAQYEEEANNISDAIMSLISRQPNPTEMYDKLIKRYKQYKLSLENVRFDECCKFIQEQKYKILDRDSFLGFLKIYDEKFTNTLQKVIEDTPLYNLPILSEFKEQLNQQKNSQLDEIVSILRSFTGKKKEKELNEEDEKKQESEEREIPEVTKNKLEDIINATFKNYIGMEDVKDKLRQIVAKHKKGLLPEAPIVVMLTGNPGTGKTTASELMTKVLYECGVLQKDNMTKIVASNLQGEFVGQTNPKVQKMFKNARKGSLLLDEIYSLATARTFADEAIAELLLQFENKENAGTLVVVAGYADKINDFLDKNQGLKDRLFSRINLRDFTHDELLQVAKKTLKKKNFKIDKDALLAYNNLLEKAEKMKDFGNARYVVNSLEEILEIQNERTFDEPENRTINLNDVELFKTNQERNKPNNRLRTLGFIQ